MSFIAFDAAGRRRPMRALSLGLALLGLTATAAFADTLTVTDIAAPAGSAFELNVPGVTVVDGNLSEPSIRALFGTDPLSALPTLAGLTATSVEIPEITVTVPAVTGSTSVPTVISMHDLRLDGVENGVAASTSIGGWTLTGPEDIRFELGATSTGRFDIASLLAFYGMGGNGSGSTEMKQIYTDFAFEGGTLSGTGFSCTIGAAHAQGYSARPLKQSWTDIYALIAKAETAEKEGETLPPETVRKLVDFYLDLFTAYSSKPIEVEGFECAGNDDSGKPFHLASGAFTMGGYKPGIFPQMSLSDLDITGEDGLVRLGNFTWKRMDFTGAIEALRAATTLDEAWFSENWRKIVPALEGFSVSDLEVDIPDEQNPGERLTGSLDSFDLTLGHYVNGTPADISLTLEGLVVPITATMTESPAPELLARGITEVTLGLATELRWDEPTSTLVIDNLLIDAGDLGLVSISGVLGNATAELFADSTDAATAAAMLLTIKEVTVHVVDHGVGELLVASGAKESGQPAESFRVALAGMAQGMTMAFLGNSDDALAAAKALGQFLGGTASELTFTITARDPAGLGLADLAAIETNPAALAAKISVTAQANGEPVTLPETVAADDDSAQGERAP